MSSNYHKNLMDVVENSLLHLYMKVLTSPRIIPTNRRNEILVKFLKPKVSLPRYKNIKSDVRQLVLFGRAKNKDLEKKIIELDVLTRGYEKTTNDLQKLFDLLANLESKYEFTTRFLKESEKPEPDVVYVIQEHIDHCFNDNGQQVAPISLLIETVRCTDLVAAISSIGLFAPELKQSNKVTSQVHIILHPVAQLVQQAS